MSKQKPMATEKTDGTQKVEQISTVSKEATARRRVNMKMMQNVLLIWLDNNINEENDANCRNTIKQLQHIVNSINTFTDSNQCIEFLEANNNGKACMIISDSFGQHIMPRIHDMSQVDSIFIFCGNNNYDEQWVKQWSKIKGVFREISPICHAVKEAVQQCEHNSISFSIMTTNGDTTSKKLDQLNPAFMYTQIFKEILLSIKFEENNHKDFTEYCRKQFAENEVYLKSVEKLEQTYHNETPIWWYTYECFLYSMLNCALRHLDGDIIIRMGFFINDLHRHIETLHNEQFGNLHDITTFTVYRGQGMLMADFDQLMNTKGGLISFNNFLSTSKDRAVALLFAESNQSNPNLVGVLFIMTINPSLSSTPYAAIAHVSFYKDSEAEILFSMHTVFRIRDIKPIDGNHRLFQVNLTLTNDNDKDLRMLTDRIREETEASTAWDRLGSLLVKIGQPKKAQQVYEVLLDQTTDEKKIGNIYYQLGSIKNDQGKYREALTFLEKSIEIYNKIYHSNHPDLAKSYSNIGLVYDNMGEYSKALLHYEKAFEIWQESLSSNHPDLASPYNNVGLVYCNTGKYMRALSFHEKALEIWQQSLPWDHPDLARSYSNIGLVYYNMGEYSKALSYYEKAFEIRQQSLPSKHPDLASPYNNIGLVHYNMGEYSKALSFHEKALEIWQQSLPSKHLDLVNSYNSMGEMYEKMGEYLKALSFYEKVFLIRQQMLPANHPHLAESYDNIGLMYKYIGEYLKALSSHKEAVKIREQSLCWNHPDLVSTYSNIGNVYESMGEYSEACSYYEYAVDIGERSLPSNHSNLQKWRGNLERIKLKL